MASAPLMPKATAVWLVDNTSLTFEQIADFCQLHELEVKGIADGDVAQGIRGMDPMVNGQLMRDELERAEADPAYRMKMAEPKVEIPEVKTKRGPRYTPVSRRQDRPDAISWLLRYHPELTDGQVMKLVGTTKPTIQAIRDRTHWNTPNITPKDPVTLGLCSQSDLDAAVQKAARRVERERQKEEAAAIKAGTLLPTSETVSPEPVAEEPQHATIIQAPVDVPAAPEFNEMPASDEPAPAKKVEEPEYDADSVFAKLKDLDLGSDDKPDSAASIPDTGTTAEPDAAEEAPADEGALEATADDADQTGGEQSSEEARET